MRRRKLQARTIVKAINGAAEGTALGKYRACLEMGEGGKKTSRTVRVLSRSTSKEVYRCDLTKERSDVIVKWVKDQTGVDINEAVGSRAVVPPPTWSSPGGIAYQGNLQGGCLWKIPPWAMRELEAVRKVSSIRQIAEHLAVVPTTVHNILSNKATTRSKWVDVVEFCWHRRNDRKVLANAHELPEAPPAPEPKAILPAPVRTPAPPQLIEARLPSGVVLKVTPAQAKEMFGL